MFELFIVIILALVIRMIIMKTKSFYKVKKKHREIMKLFKPERVPFKVRFGLKRFFRKSKFKQNKVKNVNLGFDNHLRMRSNLKAVPISFALLPMCIMFEHILLLLPLILGASLIVDWVKDIRILYPCNRPFARNSSGYWVKVLIDVDSDLFIIKSVDDGASWGTNHPTYNDNTAYKITDMCNCAYASVAISIDDYCHVFVTGKSNKARYVRGNSNGDFGADIWKKFDGTPGVNDVSFHDASTTQSGSFVVVNNHPYCVWSEKDTICDAPDSYYEIKYRYRGDAVWSGDCTNTRLTIGSATNNYGPALAVDGNGHFHCAWYYSSADRVIKYGHSHTFVDSSTWYHADDTTPITTGLSAETLFTGAGKDYHHPSISANPELTRYADIWVCSRNDTDNEIHARYYDKSAGAWQASAKISNVDNVDTSAGHLGIDSDGNVHVIWNIATTGTIRHIEWDDGWGAIETLES